MRSVGCESLVAKKEIYCNVGEVVIMPVRSICHVLEKTLRMHLEAFSVLC